MPTLTAEQFKQKYGQQATNKFNVTISAAEFQKLKSAQPQQSSGFFSDVAKSAKERLGNVVNSFKRQIVDSNDTKKNLLQKQNPIETGLQSVGQGAGFIGDVAYAGINALTDRGLEKVATKVGENKDIQNVASKINDWAKNNPRAAADLQAVVDIASLMPVGKGGSIIEKSAIKGLTKTGEIIAEKSPKLVSETSKLLKTAGEKSFGLAVKMEEPTKIALQSYEAANPTLFGRIRNFVMGEKPRVSNLNAPITEANTAVRKGLMGSEWQIGVQAKQVSQNLWDKTISPALKSSKEKINMPSFLKEIRSEIIKTSDLNRRKVLLDAFQKFSNDFKNVGSFGLEKLQQYKQDWAKFVPEATHRGKVITGSLNEIRNLASKKARNIIYDKLGPEVKQAYFDYGNLGSIAKAGEKSVEGLGDKSFSRKVYEMILDKAVTPVATIGGQILYKTGEGLEFIGKKGATKVKDIVK